MSASAATHLPAAPRHGLDRVRATLAAVGAAVLGAAPHVLHHAGPLAGAALLAGVSGKLLFGALGLRCWRSRCCAGCSRRHGSWAVPGGVLALMAVVFTFSSFVIGPALTDSGGESTTPATNAPCAPRPGVSPSEHEAHHR